MFLAPFLTGKSPTKSSRYRLLYVGLATSFAFLLLFTAFARSSGPFEWEIDLTQWMQNFNLGKLEGLRYGLFWMGSVGVAGVVLVLAVAFLWSLRFYVEAAFVLLTAVPNAANYAVRYIIGRPRPTYDLVEIIGGPQGFSFPSGHALHVLFFYGFLVYLAVIFLSRRWLKFSLVLGTAIYISFSGIWLMYDGRHWFSDVVGGYIYGAFYLLLWIIAYQWIKVQVEEFQRFRFLYLLLQVPVQIFAYYRRGVLGRVYADPSSRTKRETPKHLGR